MNVLITGIHGFVGSNLVEYLGDRFSIYGLDIVSPPNKKVIKTFTWDDFEQKNKANNDEDETLPNFDVVIHLAGKAHDTKNHSRAESYFRINTDLTKKIYDYSLEHGVRKFVFFSSVKAAADTVSDNVLTEDVVPSPVGPYGESKIAAERYILSREKERIDKGLDAFIMRPCMIHGPGNKGNLNLLYSVVNMHIPWPLGAFENHRSFTSIENLCYVIEQLIVNPIESGIYHMGDDEALSTNELIEVICNTLGRKAHIWRIPCPVMKLVAKIGGWLHLPLNTERLRKLTENYVVSNEKIKRAIGIDRMPVRAVEGLERTIMSFKR